MKKGKSGRILDKNKPSDYEAEKIILAGMLAESSLVDIVAGNLNVSDFYSITNQHIFSALLSISANGASPDLITLRDELISRGKLEECGGKAGLLDIMDRLAPTTESNMSHYIRIVADMASRRRVIDRSYSLMESAYANDNIGELSKMANDIIAAIDHVKDKESYRPISDVIMECSRIIEAMATGKSLSSGIMTGFFDLDSILGGLNRGDLILLAGRPSMGKTSLAMNIAEHIAAGGGKVIVFSLETTIIKLAWRMAIQMSRVNSRRLKNGSLSDSEWKRIMDALTKINDMDIVVDESFIQTPAELSRKTRLIRKKGNNSLDLIVVDYLQLMGSGKKTQSGNDEITEISRGLKMLAKEADCPVLALSQLSREVEKRNDKRPKLSDLRGSGSLEQDADAVLFIYRDEVYNPGMETEGIAEVIVEKQKDGPIGMAKLAFLKECMRFMNLARDLG